MSRVRSTAGLLLIIACTALIALQLWRVLGPLSCAQHVHLCQRFVPPNPFTIPVRIYTMLVGIVFGIALMCERRTRRKVDLRIYGAVALIPSAIADIAISLKMHGSRTQNPAVDGVGDAFCLAVGIWLYLSYRRSKKKESAR